MNEIKNELKETFNNDNWCRDIYNSTPINRLIKDDFFNWVLKWELIEHLK